MCSDPRKIITGREKWPTIPQQIGSVVHPFATKFLGLLAQQYEILINICGVLGPAGKVNPYRTQKCSRHTGVHDYGLSVGTDSGYPLEPVIKIP
jgi:hypothetical protein